MSLEQAVAADRDAKKNLVGCDRCFEHVPRDEANTAACSGCEANYDRDWNMGSMGDQLVNTLAMNMTAVTTPERPSRPRVAPVAPRRTLPRFEGVWRGREESPGPPKPLFRLDVPAPTPAATPAAPRKILQRCNMPQDECGLFCRVDLEGLYHDIPGECPFCHSTGIKYMPEDDFLAEPDHSKHIWLTWNELGVSTPGWVIGNLADLDWNDADPSWSHEEEPQAPEEDAEEEPEEEEVDEEEEDLFDDYDGEHGDYPCDD